MNTISKILCVLAVFFLAACSDFHGPWDYYPEKRDVYTGIFTYGTIVAGENPEICFSKIYELDEASAQNFAFYDSAYVTVKGYFKSAFSNEKDADMTIVLRPYSDKPNCFSSDYMGVVGKSYSMDAYFEWDSSGHKAKSRYTAKATIPTPVRIKGLNVPLQNGDYEWLPYDEENPEFKVKFLEYPMDMEFVKCAVDFDREVAGAISVLRYGIKNAESQKTTINNMFKGFTSEDDEGYRGIAMHDPLEKSENLGFSMNRWVGGYNMLDTLYLMNMMMPLGEIYVDFYATDDAYVDYETKVTASFNDSRVVPESNIENGMGVFSGMSKTTISLYVEGDGVSMSHIALSNCDNASGDNSGSWDSRGCRLYQDVACASLDYEYDGFYDDLISLNERAYKEYRDSVHNRHLKTCYASHVKAAMMLDTTKWSLFLPDTIGEGEKFMAYSDGLKRYCVASNFENNKIADCYDLYQQCIESPEKNSCKEYLWLWCADRGWPDTEQCKSALVSRYYLQEQKSRILQREVQNVCNYYHPAICDNWCEKQKDGHMKCPESSTLEK